MSNTFFQFKQFTVHQDRCAMKVCTDACLFGAWMAEKVQTKKYEVQTVLDIGTGTGLLSLLLAQKTAASIDAIELDEPAAEQAAENFELSPWKDRLQVIRGDARTLHLGKKYGLIISNPPFFDHDLKSADAQRNTALHSKELNLRELLMAIKKNLTDKGKFAVLLPFHRKTDFGQMALQEGFFLEEEVSVKQTSKHAFFRVMLLFSAVEVPTSIKALTIRDGEQYSTEFTYLLSDYYLKL